MKNTMLVLFFFVDVIFLVVTVQSPFLEKEGLGEALLDNFPLNPLNSIEGK